MQSECWFKSMEMGVEMPPDGGSESESEDGEAKGKRPLPVDVSIGRQGPVIERHAF